VADPPPLAPEQRQPCRGTSRGTSIRGPATAPDPAGNRAGPAGCECWGQFDTMIPLPLVPCPTASTVPLLEAAIPARKLTPSGVPTMAHFEPFQCSANVPRSRSPVTPTSLAATAATP